MAQPVATIQISTKGANGETVTTPPVPLALMKKALGRRRPKGDTPMVSSRDSGEEASCTVAAGQLRAFIERIERLEEEKRAISDDIKDVYGEMKGSGYDTKAVRAIIRLRKKDEAERQEEEAMLDLYKNALGML